MGNKNRLDRKNTLLIIIGVFILLIIFIFIYYFNFKEKKQEEKYNSDLYKLTEEYEKKQKEKPLVTKNEEGELIYSEVLTEDDKEKIGNEDTDDNNKIAEDKLQQILECINNNDYEKFYSMFNKQFISDFDYNMNEFSAKYNFEGGALGEITNFHEENKNIIFTVKFTEKSTGYIMITDFTLFEDDTIADIAVSLIIDVNNVKTVDKIKYTISRCYKNSRNVYYVIEIDNKSEYLLNIKDMLIKSNNAICTYEYLGNEDDKTVYPGIPVKFRIKLYNIEYITELKLQCIDINNNMKEIEILKE